MYELIPILSGVAAGLAALRLPRAAGIPLVLVVALVAALVAGTVSGELAESWAFLLWDGGQAIVAAAAVMALPWLGRAAARGG